jgi:hypothetical protein
VVNTSGVYGLEEENNYTITALYASSLRTPQENYKVIRLFIFTQQDYKDSSLSIFLGPYAEVEAKS